MQKKIYITTTDYLLTGEKFDLILDCDFELLKTHPQPPIESLGKYYQSTEYISHTDTNTGLLAKLYSWVKRWSLQKKASLIYKQNGGVGNLLDIGAGTGDFLKIAKNKGWKVYGMEPNQDAAKLARTKGIELKPTLSYFNNHQFDVITLWHVLEHIPNLEETIRNLNQLLTPNGILIIAVPNYKSFDAKYYQEYWAAYDVPRHLWHFSRKSIERLFAEDFRIEKIKPMIFDSFYVSLLSEKYKNGNPFSIRALGIGLLSNFNALRTKEYSSLIYCLKKLK